MTLKYNLHNYLEPSVVHLLQEVILNNLGDNRWQDYKGLVTGKSLILSF